MTKYVDESGTPGLKIKPQASGPPLVQRVDANGTRVDEDGNPVSRTSSSAYSRAPEGGAHEKSGRSGGGGCKTCGGGSSGESEAKKDAWVATHPIEAALGEQRQLLLKRQKELQRWNAADQANFKTFFGTTIPDARRVIQDRVQRELELNEKTTPAKFDVVDADKVNLTKFARVHPNDPEHRITLDGAFATAPLTGKDSKAGTLAHEMSHFTDVGGTEDYVYGLGPAKKLAETEPLKALYNADSFEYYVEGNK